MNECVGKTILKTFDLFPSAPPAPENARGRHRTFAWLLAATGAVSIALLLVSLLAAGRAAQDFRDVNLSGSLRFRSLWVYGTTHQRFAQGAPDMGVAVQMDTMRGIRRRLSEHYPGAVAATDPAWNAFSLSLQQTGQVDWRTANALRVASNILTGQIEEEASAQNASAASLLVLGLAGLFCALAACGFLLTRLRAAETEMCLALADLQENRDLFLRSINAMQEAYIVQDQDGIVLLCNADAERLLGVATKELIGSPVMRSGWRFLRETGEELTHTEHPSWQALKTGQPQEAAVVGLERPFQETAWFSTKSAPIFHVGQAVPYAAVITFSDISAGKKAEEALRVQEDAVQREREFQAAMLESLQAGIVACDADGVLTLFNRAAREFHGLPEQSLPPEEWAQHFDLFEPDGMTPLATEEIPLFRAWRGEVVRDAEMVIAPKDRLARTLLASGQAIYGSDGQKLGAVVAMHDITARRRIERELSRLASIVQSSEEAILAMTLDGTIVSWNAGAERLYGYAEEEIIGHHASVLVPGGQVSVVDGVIPRLLRGETIAPVEVVRQRRNGAVLNLALTFSPLHDENGESGNGKIVGLSCISRDITAQRQAEDALRESEVRLRYLSDAAFEGIAVSQNGVILDANAAFLTLYGYDREQILGLDGINLAVPEDRALVRRKIVTGEEDAYEARCLRRDGSTFQAELRGRMVLWGGQPARVTAVRDITERKEMEDALRAGHQIVEESAARLAEAQRIAKVGSWEYDPLGGEVVWSGEMFRLLGRAPEAGVPPFEEAMAHYHPEDAPALKSLVQRAMREGAGYSLDLRGNPSVFGDGVTRWYHTTGEVTQEETGRVVRLTGTLADVTERKEMESTLRRSEEALRAMLGSAPVILYAADTNGLVTLSEGTGLAALGLAPGEAVGRSVFEFTEGDAVMTEAARRALAGEAVSCDMRSGTLCLHVDLKPQRDADGTITGIIGVCFDITERAQSEERFRVLFEQSSDAHLLFDDDGIIDCNAAALTMMRCTDKARLLGVHPSRLSPECQPDGRLSREKGDEMCALARKNGTHHFEWVRLALDGTEIPVAVTLTEVTLNERRVLLSVWHDLTERKEAEQQIKDYMVILEFQKNQLEETNKELEALATTDGLTGLKNRRTFGEKLTEEHARAVRYHQPLSLLLLDVDHFKQYNDTFGHPAGDVVLRSVAQALGSTARDTDVAARYGGEEFVLILPQTEEAGALVIAERIRTVIAEGEWELRPVTVSVGVATLSLDTPTPDSLTACADKALYYSKEAGRNRVTHGNPSAPFIASRPARPKRPRAAKIAAESASQAEPK